MLSLERSRRASLAALILACIVSCGRDEPEPVDISTPGASVLLFIVDTLRADVLGPYGGREETSPTLSRLAAEGVLFEQCRASSPWTLPSLGSIFTGLYPRAHGAGLAGLERSLHNVPRTKYGPTAPVPERGSQPSALANEIPTLTETFARGGYETFLLATNTLYEYGLSKDFEHYVSGPATAASVVSWGLTKLQQRDPSKPFFMTLHFIDVHINELPVADMASDMALFNQAGRPALGPSLRKWATYSDIPERFEPRLGDRFRMYQASARYVDRQVGRMLAALEEMNVGPLYVVYTSDHGEDFRDHWEVDKEDRHTDPRRNWSRVHGIGHGHNLHAALTHVPLVLRGPKLPRGWRVASTVGLVDILPTLCELTALEPLAPTNGRSLVPHITGRDVRQPAYVSESLAYGREKTAFYSPDGMLLIHPRSGQERPQLFDLDRDPHERRNLIDEQPARAKALLRDLEAWEAKLQSRRGQPHEIDAKALEGLRGLGYVGEQ